MGALLRARGVASGTARWFSERRRSSQGNDVLGSKNDLANG